MNHLEVIRTENVLVRVMELEKDASTDWHYHSEVADFFVCLKGAIKIETKNPDELVILNQGQRAEIKPPKIHRVLNSHSGKAEYLLIQGVGRYDFNKV